jgi:hypothetical protein
MSRVVVVLLAVWLAGSASALAGGQAPAAGGVAKASGASTPAASGGASDADDDEEDDDQTHPGGATKSAGDQPVFGATQNASTTEKGSWSGELNGQDRFGKRSGSYAATSGELTATRGLTDQLQVAFSLFSASYDIQNAPFTPNRNEAGFDGLGLAAKWALAKRGVNGPLGFALEAELGWHRTDDTSGAPGRFLEVGLTAIAELELQPGRLYLGTNLGFSATNGVDASGGSDKSANLNGSVAMGLKLTDAIKLAAEAQIVSSFGGIFAYNKGTAVFVGPTLSLDLGSDTYLSVTYHRQAWGTGHGGLDLRDFERQRIMLSLSHDF